MSVLSAVQFKPRLASCQADVLDNFRKCEPLIHQAHTVGSQFLVFPELFLTGYSFMSMEEAGRVCERQDGPTFRAMRRVAQDLKSYISWGYVRLGESGKLYNSATMVDPNGSVITQYDKINLWGNDFLWATPGELAAPIVETELGKISIIICRDLRDKIPQNIPRIASRNESLFSDQQVDIVAVCANWGKSGFPSTSWMDFSVNNQCTLVLANRWGEEINDTFRQDFGQGGSVIVEKNWKVHTSGLVFGEDCVVTAVMETP